MSVLSSVIHQKVIKTTIITQDMATNKEHFTLSHVANITFFISAVVMRPVCEYKTFHETFILTTAYPF